MTTYVAINQISSPDGDDPEIPFTPRPNVPPNIFDTIKSFKHLCLSRKAEEILKLRPNDVPSLDYIKTQKDESSRRNEWMKYSNETIKEYLEKGLNTYNDQNNLLFLAAASLDLTLLHEKLSEIAQSDLNEPKNNESIVIFTLKYADPSDEKTVTCMEMLLNAGADINWFTHNTQPAIDTLVSLFDNYKYMPNALINLRKLLKLLLEKGIEKPLNEKTYSFLEKEVEMMEVPLDLKKCLKEMSYELKLFYFISTEKKDEFLKLFNNKSGVPAIEKRITLLQLACRKSDKMLPVVKKLLKQGADVNETSEADERAPLELAGLHRNQQIFEEVIKQRKLNITEKQFEKFISYRATNQVKSKIFAKFLESDKVDPNFTYGEQKNTPLYYAIVYNHTTAIINQLKHGATLSVRILNKINPDDLETFFDSCLKQDNFTESIADPNYKFNFHFDPFLRMKPESEENERCEMESIMHISKSQNLQHLLTHILVHTFLQLKWTTAKKYFWFILVIRILFFLTLLICIDQIDNFLAKIVCLLLTIAYIFVKLPLLVFQIKNTTKNSVIHVFKNARLDSWIEALLIFTILLGFLKKELFAFAYVEMAISLLLTMGYHPKLAKWSIMLQEVFKSFTILLLFFSLIIAAFGLGFHALFQDKMFSNAFSSVFKAYIMTVGEFNINENEDFEKSGVMGYIIYWIFAMSMALVIVNFWTGVAVADIEKIEKNAEINASKNVIKFLVFIENVYSAVKCIPCLSSLMEPSLLPLLKETEAGEQNQFNIYINKPHLFDSDVKFISSLDEQYRNRLKEHYFRMKKNAAKMEKLEKLDQILVLLKKCQK